MKQKRILVTSTDVMMLQFLVPHVFFLRENGFTVDVACSNVEGHIEELEALFAGKVDFEVIGSVRSPLSPKNVKGYRQLKKKINAGHYDLIWTNEPVMGVLTRLAARKARKKGTKVLYVAHGFHFYQGAPKKKWLLYYPIEKMLSRATDRLITINREDTKFAETHFQRCKPEYFHGIGINTEKFRRESIDTFQKREELNIPSDAKLYLSVAELEKRKNHETVIRAFAQANLPNSYLLICGLGTQREVLESLIETLGMSERVRLLGYRYDIRELLETADVFVLGSYQEGLSVAIMEAMAMQKLCVVSKIRGNTDLIDGTNGILFDPKQVDSVKAALELAYREPEKYEASRMANPEKLKAYDFEVIRVQMLNTIRNLIGMDAV